MVTDIREKAIEAAFNVMLGRVNAPEQEVYRVAGDLADFALKAAAEVAGQEIGFDPWVGEPSYMTGPQAADAILALISEGVSR